MKDLLYRINNFTGSLIRREYSLWRKILQDIPIKSSFICPRDYLRKISFNLIENLVLVFKQNS